MIKKLVHTIFWKFGANGTYAGPDEESFDHAPFERLQQYAPDAEVRLWTYSRLKAFCEKEYPHIWARVQHLARPVMLVDVLRWVVVYHFGGLYWQLGCEPLVPLPDFMPPEGKGVRLLTELDLTETQRWKEAMQPIRGGQPEEAKRIVTQIFAARQRSPFVGHVIDFLLKRCERYQVKCDYDILFIAGNGAVSTAYDLFGKTDNEVECVPLAQARKMAKLKYTGSWRTDKKEVSRAASTVTQMALPPKGGVEENVMQFGKGALYAHFLRHGHERLWDGMAQIADAGKVVERLQDFVAQEKVQSVFVCPAVGTGDAVIGRKTRIVVGNPSHARIGISRWLPRIGRRYFNGLYSQWPHVEMAVLPEYFNWLPFGEIARILSRLCHSHIQWIALGHCPLLGWNWDAALGAYRPLHYGLEPFHFPAPFFSVPFPCGHHRSDCRLSVWKRVDVCRALGGME